VIGIIAGLIALYIAWIWVDYFRLIDVFEKDKLWMYILTFIMGGFTVILPLALAPYTDSIFQLSGDLIDDLLFAFLKVGFVEELAKIIPFLFLLLAFKKQLDEPMDYIIFISISALGFSAVENVFYFTRSGPTIIQYRSILTSVGHMFDTSLFAYGIIQYQFRGKPAYWILLGFLMAVFSHGFYDFWLFNEHSEPGSWLVSIFFFMLSISLYATILNNALNLSPYFTYAKTVDAYKVSFHLLKRFGILFIIVFVLNGFTHDWGIAQIHLLSGIFSAGFLIAITAIRLSRFKLIKNHWQPLYLELPFYFGTAKFSDGSSRVRLFIRGESYNESAINTYFEKPFDLVSMSAKKWKKIRPARIIKKFYLRNEELFYIVEVENDQNQKENYLMKPKIGGQEFAYDKYPIASLIRINPQSRVKKHWSKRLIFIEWVYLKPRTKPHVYKK
jgi:RsiW-degrading membrane proteinase PrsW (M82 family)